ncbi:MAG: hypothetical protein GEU26_12825 [Nitrososphaeraceae archaeon]|nr:hypothetical protein [Nitrososphaeraceae archaeon]
METAEEICNCANSTRERMKKEITQCDKDRIVQYLPMKIVIVINEIVKQTNEINAYRKILNA